MEVQASLNARGGLLEAQIAYKVTTEINGGEGERKVMPRHIKEHELYSKGKCDLV